MGWLLVLGLKECLVDCATLCVKSEVMLLYMYLGKAVFLTFVSGKNHSYNTSKFLFVFIIVQSFLPILTTFLTFSAKQLLHTVTVSCNEESHYNLS